MLVVCVLFGAGSVQSSIPFIFIIIVTSVVASVSMRVSLVIQSGLVYPASYRRVLKELLDRVVRLQRAPLWSHVPCSEDGDEGHLSVAVELLKPSRLAVVTPNRSAPSWLNRLSSFYLLSISPLGFPTSSPSCALNSSPPMKLHAASVSP